MVYFTFFATITLLVYAVFVWREDRKKHMKKRMAMFTGTGNQMSNQEIENMDQEMKKNIPILRRLLYPVWKEFKRSFKRRMPGQKQAVIDMKLLRAGSPMNMTAVEFRILQFCLLLLFPVLFGLYALLGGMGIGAVFLLSITGITLAWGLPHYYLSLKIKQRVKQALRELPDVLDLLTVSLEAGLGFDSALTKMVSKKKGVLVEEFHRCIEEIRLGKTRKAALSGVRNRLELDEMKILISNILQAEKLGIGIVTVLRVQSEEVRQKRKQRAEEEAMKAPIKMLFPLVLFIFPSLFIVLLGPALIQFMTTFAD